MTHFFPRRPGNIRNDASSFQVSLLDLGAILFFSMLPFWAMEAIKAVNRKWAFYNVV